MSEWKIGFPKQLGVYQCRINHEEETRLRLFRCPLGGKKYWKNISGQPQEGYIEWTGDPTTFRD